MANIDRTAWLAVQAWQAIDRTGAVRTLPRGWWACLGVVLLTLLPATAWPDPASRAPALNNVAVLVDRAGTVTIADVAGADPGRFVPLPGGSLTRGYSRAAHWLRLTVDAPAGTWILDILPPFLNDLRVYLPDPDKPGEFVERKVGNLLPFGARDIDYRGFAFRLDKPDGKPLTLFLRVTTTSSTVVVPRIWSPKDFSAMETREAILLASSLALLVTLMILNLIHWVWIRDPLLPWFVAYVGSLALTTASGVTGFAFQYLLPNQPVVADVLIKVSTLLAIASGTGFYQRLFDVDRSRPRLFLLYRIGFWAPLAMIVPGLSGYYIDLGPLVLVLVLVINSANLVLAGRLWRRGAAGGGLMFIANLIGLLGATAMILNLLGLINGGLPALYSMQIASLGTTLALHLALGDRFRVLRDERQQALADAAQEKHVREQQSRFFAMMSHELKTPLAVIDSAAQVLQDITEPTPEATRRHARIREAVRRIDRLMDQAMQPDRLAEATPLPLQPVDLQSAIEDILPGFPDHQARLHFQHLPCPPVPGSPSMLKVMLGNLIDNALKYSPAPHPVLISLRREGNTAEVDVRDSGPGIPRNQRGTVFERYVRGSAIGDIPGTGLGLYIVRQIAERHDGRVEIVESPDGVGALFRVTLPLVGGKP